MGVAILFILPRVECCIFINVVLVELPKRFSAVSYICLDSCKTMPILCNVIKSDRNKGDIMGYMSNGHLNSIEFFSKNS